jgi:predicted ArsR family transcriptional regulator
MATALRSYNEIPRHTAERQRANGWMNLIQAAEFLDINTTTLRQQLDELVQFGFLPLKRFIQ